MPQIALSVEGLKALDNGLIAKLLDEEMKRAVKDCQDRPGDKKSRVVTLKINISPFDVAGGGDLEGCYTSFDVDSTMPKKKSRDYPTLVHRNGQLSFSENNAENPRQGHIDDVLEKSDE